MFSMLSGLLFILNVTMLSVFMLSAIMLSAIMLSAIMLSIIMLHVFYAQWSVVYPECHYAKCRILGVVMLSLVC